MGKAVDFIHATNDVLTERGVELPLDGQAVATPDTRASEGRVTYSAQSESRSPVSVLNT